MCDARYNGWANYETWVVNLWPSNEEGAYRDWERAAAEGPESARAFIEEYIGLEEMGACLVTDLLNSALDEVDWDEITAAYTSDEEDEEDEEDEKDEKDEEDEEEAPR